MAVEYYSIVLLVNWPKVIEFCINHEAMPEEWSAPLAISVYKLRAGRALAAAAPRW